MGGCFPEMIGIIENHEFLVFFKPLKSKIELTRRRNANFHSWVTRLPIEMNVHVANSFWRLLQIPAFYLLASKHRISNSSTLQGRRVNRLPLSLEPTGRQKLGQGLSIFSIVILPPTVQCFQSTVGTMQSPLPFKIHCKYQANLWFSHRHLWW